MEAPEYTEETETSAEETETSAEETIYIYCFILEMPTSF
jgi:hypothetical protein